jgi:hypothetical protein
MDGRNVSARAVTCAKGATGIIAAPSLDEAHGHDGTLTPGV